MPALIQKLNNLAIGAAITGADIFSSLGDKPSWPADFFTFKFNRRSAICLLLICSNEKVKGLISDRYYASIARPHCFAKKAHGRQKAPSK